MALRPIPQLARIHGAPSFDDNGVTGGVAAAMLLSVVGFFNTGTSAKITNGSQIKALIDEDVPLAFNATGAAPQMVAPAPQPVVVLVTPK